MRNKISLAMGLHFHQPVGNFDDILERAYQNCYKPFLDCFSKYPDMKMTVHFSGNLLDYFEERHPEFLDKVKGLVEATRVEIMGGGYYEPIFQAIPKRDRIGQVDMLSRYCENRFGARPVGAWIPERVWSPDIAEDLLACGIKYSILDDIHLLRAGVKEDELHGYFMTQGNSKLAIFPSNKVLRYSIPFKSHREIINYFKRMAKKKDVLLTCGDDVEKFGEWPWTYNWVYKKGWLDNFFKELVKNKDWINTVLFSEYLDSRSPMEYLHIPEGAYEEMMEWSGGAWMNFLSKYPEADQMHKRMMYVSKRLSELRNKGQETRDKEKLEDAEKELYKAQTNCAYWHGVFGGIYLHNLRSAVYKHLIEADKIADEVSCEEYSIKEYDFYNNSKAIIAEDRNFFISIDPGRGGIIRELDYKPKSTNLVNTLGRHKELYHKKILERINNNVTSPQKIYEAIKKIDVEIKKGIFYDRYLRSCLIDHFIDKDLSKEDFENSNFVDLGDFADGAYISEIKGDRVVLHRDGAIGDKEVLIQKELTISGDKEIDIFYSIKNKSDSLIDVFFGTEFNITMPYANSERYSWRPRKRGFSVEDSKKELGLEFIFSADTKNIWHFPLKTVSQSERSYSLNYQSTSVFPMWDISFDSGKEASFSIKLRIL